MYFMLIFVFLIALFLFWTEFTETGGRWFRKRFRGPELERRDTDYGTYIKYQSGYIVLRDIHGDELDVYKDLYESPRTWHLCTSRSDDRATSVLTDRDYFEMCSIVEELYSGRIDYVDIYTGLVHYRIA